MRLNDFYDDFVQPKSLSAIFLDFGKSSCISYKMTNDSHRILSSPRIPEDDLPGPGRFWLTTSRNRTGPDKSSPAICDAIRWLTGAWLIPACRKPESARFRLVIFRELKNRGKWLWLDKVISEIIKPHKLVLSSSREIVPLKIFFSTCRPYRILLRIEWA